MTPHDTAMFVPRHSTIALGRYSSVVGCLAAFIAATHATVGGARVFNLHGESDAVSQVVAWIEEAAPGARGLISAVDTPLPLPAALDDGGLQRAVGPVVRTPLREGIRQTVEEFRRLQEAEYLDARELA